MRKNLCKIQYVLFVLLMFALSACGTSSSTADKASGKITAQLVLPKEAGKTVASQANVTTTRLTVTGPTIPIAKQDYAGSAGGTIEVYPGDDIIVTAQALNSSGVVLYEGFATNVTVTSGQTTNVGTIVMNAPIVKATDTSCLSCHESTRDITGQNLVADYKQSGHYTNTSWTANAKDGSTLPGCAGCHGTQHNDLSPAASGRCFQCHGANLSLRHTAPIDPNATPSGARFLNADGTNCSACHEPHNPLDGAGKQQRKDWAATGHGDVNAQPWNEETWGSPCIACHTAGGFVQALDSNWTNTAVTAATPSGMPLNCNGCHKSDDFENTVRTIPGGYTAGMGGFGSSAKASIQFQDVGESNLCLPCHASRENGQSIIKGVSNYANQSFKNPHYLAAAAVFYGKGGFQYYSSTSQTPYAPQAYTTKYGVVVDGTIIKTSAASTSNSTPAIAVGDVLIDDKAAWQHGKLGRNNFQTTKTAAVVAAKGDLVYTGSNGQCVVCHLGAGSVAGNHTFNAYKVAKSTWASSYEGCYGCHTSEDMEEVGDLEEKPLYLASMDFFKWQLAQNGAVYSDVYPYFYMTDGTTALKNWVATSTATGMFVPGGTGAANMGAAMNYKLLLAEKGAHVHNRTFMRQMIFDSVQYLQKGAVTFSNQNVPETGVTDPNGQISFSAYSTSLISTGNAGKTTQAVRGYIVRSSGGKYFRR